MHEVFPTSLGTPWHPGDLLRRHWYPMLERAGLPKMRIHDLRHSSATLLGHSSIDIAVNPYSHVLPTIHAEAMGKLSDLLGVVIFRAE